MKNEAWDPQLAERQVRGWLVAEAEVRGAEDPGHAAEGCLANWRIPWGDRDATLAKLSAFRPGWNNTQAIGHGEVGIPHHVWTADDPLAECYAAFGRLEQKQREQTRLHNILRNLDRETGP